MRSGKGCYWKVFVVVLGIGVVLPRSDAAAKTLRFGGYEWTVRSGRGGPGPNRWEEANVWLDQGGGLHLKIARRGDEWSCAEVTTRERLGYGRYEFEVEGGIDRLDDHVVLGLFNYPTPDVGGDETHEIDIEFARWGRATNPIGNYTVWPVEKARRPTSKTFVFTLDGTSSTHAFDWAARRIEYRSWRGAGTSGPEIQRWVFEPPDFEKRVAARPMPLHMNLWLFRGQAPKNGQEVEIVVRRFRFHPADG